jgi:hypothetical protein
MQIKTISIIGAVLVVAILLGTVVIFMMGGGEPSFTEDLPTMDEAPTETFNFDPTEEVMVEDEGTVYWPISGPVNSTDVVLVTGIQVRIAWSDDENPPASRPLYQNMPDTMTLDVVAAPYLSSVKGDGNDTANSTVVKSSRSDTGSTRVDLDMKSNPILLDSGSNENLSFDPAGSSEPGNSGLYVAVSCIAGHIEASRPAMLRYTDRGDEVSLTISVTVRIVPTEVFEQWVAEQTQESTW